MSSEMTHFVVGACSFMAGFALATALICRASMRPKAKEILKKAGVLKLHKARTPKKREEEEFFDWEDEKPMYS